MHALVLRVPLPYRPTRRPTGQVPTGSLAGPPRHGVTVDADCQVVHGPPSDLTTARDEDIADAGTQNVLAQLDDGVRDHGVTVRPRLSEIL